MTQLTRLFLMTHGLRFNGPDPIHTREGWEQIDALKIPEGINTVIVGTGKRFQEMRIIIGNKLPEDVPFIPSSFCGTSDGLNPGNKAILTCGVEVDLDSSYIGLVRATNAGIFNPWGFIQMFGDNTLFLAGGELMLALNTKLGTGEKGNLYKLDPSEKTAEKIS